MRRASSLLLITFALGACAKSVPRSLATIDTLPGGVIRVHNPAPSGWTDTAHIVFQEIQRIQPADGQPGELGDVRDLTMDERGRLYVAEDGPVRVDQFGPDGRFLRTIGRQGSGPGEYQVTFLAWTKGHLFVHDPELSRTSVFDSSGGLVRSWSSMCCIWRSIGSDSLGRAYIPAMPSSETRGMGWIRYSLDGTAVDTLWKRKRTAEGKYWEFHPSKNSTSRYSIPFQPGTTDIPWVGGGLLLGDNGTYTLVVSRTGTDSALVFGRDWTPQAIPEGIRRAQFESYTSRNEALKAVARFEDIPTTAPAFGDLLIDADRRIWVELTVPSDSVTSYWDLFTSSGIWLGTVHAPFRARQMVFRPGEVVVSTTDEEDLPMIVRYRMDERREPGDR